MSCGREVWRNPAPEAVQPAPVTTAQVKDRQPGIKQHYGQAHLEYLALLRSYKNPEPTTGSDGRSQSGKSAYFHGKSHLAKGDRVTY